MNNYFTATTTTHKSYDFNKSDSSIDKKVNNYSFTNSSSGKKKTESEPLFSNYINPQINKSYKPASGSLSGHNSTNVYNQNAISIDGIKYG